MKTLLSSMKNFVSLLFGCAVEIFIPSTPTKKLNTVYTAHVTGADFYLHFLKFLSSWFMKMAQLNVIFENLSKFYFEGEKVRIKLEVNLEKSSNVNHIIANFVGLSSYTSIDGKQNKMASKFFTKNPTEIYFDDVLPLFLASNKKAVTWQPGIQVFMFDFQLPHSLPSSLESAHCFVRYCVHIIAGMNGDIQKKSEYFTVISKTDINKEGSANLPGVIWKPENQCFLQELLCKTGSVRAFFHIPKRGYVPGECIFINAEICNCNRFPVEWVKATLIQILKPNGGKSFKEKRIVTEITRGCILPSETQAWRSESMVIPALPPTTFSSKKLINVKYRLCFQFKPTWQRKPTELKQKIVLGAVGVVEIGQDEQGQGEGERVYNSEYFNGSNLEPCIFGPHTIEEDGRYSTFSPLYPMHIEL